MCSQRSGPNSARVTQSVHLLFQRLFLLRRENPADCHWDASWGNSLELQPGECCSACPLRGRNWAMDFYTDRIVAGPGGRDLVRSSLCLRSCSPEFLEEPCPVGATSSSESPASPRGPNASHGCAGARDRCTLREKAWARVRSPALCPSRSASRSSSSFYDEVQKKEYCSDPDCAGPPVAAPHRGTREHWLADRPAEIRH